MRGEDTSETLLKALAEVVSAEVIRLHDYVDQKMEAHEQRAHPELRAVTHLKEISEQMQSQIDNTRTVIADSRAQLRLVRNHQQGHPDHENHDELKAIREGGHRKHAKSKEHTTPIPHPAPLRVVTPIGVRYTKASVFEMLGQRTDETPTKSDEDIAKELDDVNPAAGC